jgi:transcriptional regulator of acetoin/glycerol metabolism
VGELTRKFLRAVLMQAGGNVSRAAARAGMQRTYFHRLMKAHGVQPRDFKG